MKKQPKTQQQALERLRAFLRSEQILPPDEVPEPPWATGQAFRGAAMLYPESVEEVCRILQVCSEARQAVVPMGGLTNLVRGCETRPEDLGLSLARLNAIEELDPVAQTMTVQAGVTLREAQEAAERAGLYFPVDIGARDNCMLGGNVSTNAGGTKVIRYGMIRDSVLGLEAVLADGTLLSSMNRYVKNNSGFDLKHLFIGTEGTLGIVTRIVFRLTDKPAAHNVALLGLERLRRGASGAASRPAPSGSRPLRLRGDVEHLLSKGGSSARAAHVAHRRGLSVLRHRGSDGRLRTCG